MAGLFDPRLSPWRAQPMLGSVNDYHWSFVRDHLPPAPAHVVEIGCGPFGGFVPRLLSHGYGAAGVDPEAPEGPPYHRMVFEKGWLRAHRDRWLASGLSWEAYVGGWGSR